MPTITDLTIKKNDGTTDIIYSQVAGASGSTPALWRVLTLGTAVAHRPRFEMLSKQIGGRGAEQNQVQTKLIWPQTYIDAGLTRVANTASIQSVANLPLNMAQTDIDEIVAQFANLMKTALVQTCLKQGVAAT